MGGGGDRRQVVALEEELTGERRAIELAQRRGGCEAPADHIRGSRRSIPGARFPDRLRTDSFEAERHAQPPAWLPRDVDRYSAQVAVASGRHVEPGVYPGRERANLE